MISSPNKLFLQLSLRNKLIVINMLVAGIVLFLGSASLFLVETMFSKTMAINNLTSVGKVISLHCGAPLSFQDKQTASETLQTLASEPDILQAFLYDQEQQIFATFLRPGVNQDNQVPSEQSTKLLKKGSGYVFNMDGIHLILPVMVDGEQLGALYIQAEMNSFTKRLIIYLCITLFVILVSLVIAYFISLRLQRKISGPITDLTAVMDEISKEKKYDIVIEERGNDEIGRLYAGFKEMLAKIYKRDRALALTQYSIDHTSDGICWLTRDGLFYNVNQGACSLLGFERQDLLEKSIFSIRPELKVEEWREFWDELCLSPGLNFETEMHSREGQLVPVDVASHFVRFDHNDLCCIIFRDTSERNALQLKLQSSEKMEAVGTLAGSVAHDLNNILSSITNYPELILMDLPESSPLVQPVTAIMKSGFKAAAIVQDMLTLARRSASVKKTVNINTIIKEYLASPEYKRLCEYHSDVNLYEDLSPETANISASPIHMSKCIMNLISNAAEALPTGGDIVIHSSNISLNSPLTGYEAIREGAYVLLSVIDSGIGINNDDLKQIFEPFYTKKKMGRSGTGLGMTVVWNTVVDHNGYITVASEEGKGTRFDLFFPATLESTEQTDKIVPIDDMLGKETVLIIDDISEQRDVGTAMLSRLGYKVTAMASGEEAVSYLQDHEADIIVLDMIMEPGMDGLDTYRKIMAIRPGQKAIIASGFAETERVRKLQELGPKTFIKKPYKLEELGVAIRRELRDR